MYLKVINNINGHSYNGIYWIDSVFSGIQKISGWLKYTIIISLDHKNNTIELAYELESDRDAQFNALENAIDKGINLFIIENVKVK
jgi:hypothetical protein